jgi:hypothetical protein
MKASRHLASFFMLLAILLVPGVARSQENVTQKSAGSETGAAITQFKLQVVLTELDGSKKISSLPYVIPVTFSSGQGMPPAVIRVGVRVPINTTSKSGDSSLTYVDVGTNIDCRMHSPVGGRYPLDMNIERSYLYSEASNQEIKEWNPGQSSLSKTPVVHQIRGSFSWALADGQAANEAQITDPVSGHVTKIEVLLTVVK